MGCALLRHRGNFIVESPAGVLLTLTVQCITTLPRRLRRTPVVGFFPCYVLLVFSLGSIAAFTELKQVLESMIDNRNYPGGPVAFYEVELESRSVNLARVAWYVASARRSDVGMFNVHR
jgi:hypothetical protein